MKTILVVEDSAICREPIAAMLRLHGYHTLEAANGQEALQIARTHRPDLILLDVGMPVMDGLQCLDELRRRPRTAQVPVIMLTGAAERGIVVEAARRRIAGFLLKSSFSSSELIARVQSLIGAAKPETSPPAATERAEPPEPEPTPTARPGAHPAAPHAVPPPAAAPAPASAPPRRFSKAEVLGRATQETQLRSIKPVLEYVIALTRSSTSTVEDIASAIRQDQVLALQILRVANSSFYQRGRVAKDLIEATQRIGLTAIRNAVIAILTIEHFENMTESGLVPQRFWEHSLATAALAEMLGEAVSSKQADQLFLAGLLHDVGRMVLSSLYPAEYAAALARAAREDVDLESVEQEVFELSHVDVTRHLLSQWNMPPSIVEAASLHELPVERLRHVRQNVQSVLAVALANRMVHALLLGDSGHARLLPYHDLAGDLGLDTHTLQAVAAAAVQKTIDTQMFYASQSGGHFRDPLRVELAKQAGTAPRVVVLGPDAPADPFSLFFRQLDWLHDAGPTLVLLLARSQLDFTRYLPSLKTLDSAAEVAPAVIVVTADETLSVPAEWSSGRLAKRVCLPCSYSHLIDVAIRCSDAAVPSPTTASCA